MSHQFYCLWTHVIWSTKNRQPLISPALKYCLYDHIRKIAEEKNYHLDHINGIEDHVHCLLSLHPKFSLSDAIRHLKGASAYWINQNHIIDEPFES